MFSPRVINIRRFAYVAAFVATLIFYVFNVTYFSWILMVVIVGMPLISLGITLPMLGRCRVEIRREPLPGNEFGFAISLKVASAISGNPIKLKLKFDNLFSGNRVEERVVISRSQPVAITYEGGVCGVVRCSITGMSMADALGLFWLPLPRPRATNILLRPAVIPFSGDLTDQIESEQPDITGERHLLDMRGYQPGDPLRDIHWKLTARLGEPIVKEFGYFNKYPVTVAVNWAGRAEELAGTLGRLEGLLDYLEQEEYAYTVLWVYASGRRQQIPPRPDGADPLEYMDALLWDVLSSPAPKAAVERRPLYDANQPASGSGSGLPADIFQQHKELLAVDSNSITLYGDGLEKEVWA